MKTLFKVNVSKIYIVITMLITLVVLVSYYSYAMFTVTREKKNSINIITGDILYNLNLSGVDTNEITLEAGETKIVEVTVESLNSIESTYQLYYNNNSEIYVKYAKDTDNPKQENVGSRTGNDYIRKTILVIENKSSSKQIITIGVQGGLVGKKLTLKENRTAINEVATYMITTNSVNGGNINVIDTSAYGTNVNFSINPSTDYSYYGATIYDKNGTVLQTLDASTNSFTMPAMDITISPKWKYKDITVLDLANSVMISGWTKGKSNNSAIQYDFSNYHISFNFPTTDFSVIEFWSEEIFDLTRYDTLLVQGYGTGTNTDGYYLIAGVTKDINMEAWLWENIACAGFITKDNFGSVELDVSSLTGEYNLGVELQNNYQSSYGFISLIKLVGHIYE